MNLTKLGLLDEKGWQILRELQQDARLTFAELGRRVGLSTPSAAERVHNLEAAGILTGYHARVDLAKLGLPILAIVRVSVVGDVLARTTALVQEMPEVLECHRGTGSDSFTMKVTVASVAHLERVIRIAMAGTRRPATAITPETFSAAPRRKGRRTGARRRARTILFPAGRPIPVYAGAVGGGGWPCRASRRLSLSAPMMHVRRGPFEMPRLVVDGAERSSHMRGAKFIVFVTALILAFAASSARAQATKFVAVTGSDTNPCDVATPCRTIGAAITAVAANGEVTILTSGEYAPFTVDKAVTVAAAGGVEATIVQAGTPAEAIRVTAPANTNVVLRGLTILTRLTGTLTYGGRGISTANANLHVEHCVLDGPFVTAIRISSGRAYISDTVVRGAMDEEAILQLGPSEAWYERLHLDSTALIGLKVESAGARAVVRDSTFMKANAGVRALGGGNAIIENSGFSLNGVAIAADAGSRVTVSNSLIANNGTGIGGAGTRVTFGNNRFAGNTTNGTFTITAALR